MSPEQPNYEHVIFRGSISENIAQSHDMDLFLYRLNTIYAQTERVRARFACAIQSWEFVWDASGPFLVHALCDQEHGLALHHALQEALIENPSEGVEADNF